MTSRWLMLALIAQYVGIAGFAVYYLAAALICVAVLWMQDYGKGMVE